MTHESEEKLKKRLNKIKKRIDKINSKENITEKDIEEYNRLVSIGYDIYDSLYGDKVYDL